jgi:hypothetical protein
MVSMALRQAATGRESAGSSASEEEEEEGLVLLALLAGAMPSLASSWAWW